MRRTGRWLSSVGLLGALVAGGFAAAPAASLPLTQGVQVTVPPVTLVPGVTTPPVQVTVPPLPVPEVTVPPVPTVPSPVPGVTLPPVTVPPVTVPPLPGVTLPSLPVPLPQVPATVPGGVRPDGLVECAHFLTQQAAQAALLVDARLAALLDDDRDGVACELLPSGSATVPAPATGTAATAASAGGTAGGVGTSAAPAAAGGSSASPAAGGTPAGAAASPVARPSAGRTGPRGGSAGGGTATIQLAGDTVAAERAMEVPEAEGGHLVLTVLAFVLLLGAGVGLARELADRRSATAA